MLQLITYYYSSNLNEATTKIITVEVDCGEIIIEELTTKGDEDINLILKDEISITGLGK